MSGCTAQCRARILASPVCTAPSCAHPCVTWACCAALCASIRHLGVLLHAASTVSASVSCALLRAPRCDWNMLHHTQCHMVDHHSSTTRNRPRKKKEKEEKKSDNAHPTTGITNTHTNCPPYIVHPTQSTTNYHSVSRHTAAQNNSVIVAVVNILHIGRIVCSLSRPYVPSGAS